MRWLKLIAACLRLINLLVTTLRERQLLKAGEAEAIAESLKETHVRIEEARAARRAAADGGMRDDDPYLRD